MSISTMARSGVDSSVAIASRPVPAVSTVIPRRSSTLLSAKMLRTSSSTTSTFLPTSASSDRCSRSSIFCFSGGKIGDHAMQEQRRFVQQPFRRFHALDHDAARQRVQAGIFFGRQFLAGEDDDRQIAQTPECRAGVPAPRSRTCPAGARSSTTQSKDCSSSASSASAPVATTGDVDVVVTQQFANAQLLGGIVFDDQQPLAARRRVFS